MHWPRIVVLLQIFHKFLSVSSLLTKNFWSNIRNFFQEGQVIRRALENNTNFDLEDYGVHEKRCKIISHKHNQKLQKSVGSILQANIDEDHHYYGIRVVTGDVRGAGTINPNIFLVLIGSEYRTEKINISNGIIFSKHLKTGTFEDIIVLVNADKKTGIGDVEAVWFCMEDYFLKTTWYIDSVEIIDNGSKICYPCHHWIKGGDQICLTSKTCTINGIKDNSILVQERDKQLVIRKKKYQWEHHKHSGLPGFINTSNQDLSVDEKFEEVKGIHFTANVFRAGIFLVGEVIHEMNHSLKEEDFVKLSKKFDSDDPVTDVPRLATDPEFGNRILNGINPVVIKKCTSLPDNFPVTHDMVKNSLDSGKILEEEMENGRVFICNMKMMDGLQPRKYHVAPAPICLLYLNNREQLVPIAIQIRQGIRDCDKIKPNPIFFPNDSYYDWTLAKMYYQAADSQYHQIVTHFLCCHAVMEAYAMGTMRNLPDAHPIYKLLRPHFRFTMAINTRARASLISDGGILDILFGIGGAGRVELMKRAYQSYSVHWTNIRRSIKERGMDKIPGFYYRDDGFNIWDAIQELVTKIVDRFYATDEDVVDDAELLRWAADIHFNGFPGYAGNNCGMDFPNQFTTKADLIEHCTLIVFTGSAQHASVNFGQYDHFKFVPNAPLGIRASPPTEKGKAKASDILDTLPNRYSTPLAIGLAHILSQYSDDERYLGNDLMKYYVEEDIHVFFGEFINRLEAIGEEITERNETLDVKYTFMHPEKIPNSITI